MANNILMWFMSPAAAAEDRFGVPLRPFLVSRCLAYTVLAMDCSGGRRAHAGRTELRTPCRLIVATTSCGGPNLCREGSLSAAAAPVCSAPSPDRRRRR